MIDFAPWNEMLQTYINDQGRVDYGRWQAAAAQDLDQWLTSVNQVDWSALPRESAIAFLINLYNALTIQQVLQKYPLDSIRPTFWGIPNWLAFLRFFSKPVYRLRGRSLSLNVIEHDWLRQQWDEPRIHFALVCAAVGCPLLRSGAYWPESLNAQLEADAHRFINHPAKVRYDAASQTLFCSQIFKWYKADFLTVADSTAAYINRYLTDGQVPLPAQIAYLPYSWQLNQRTSS